jgi:hypothetical protein
LQTNLKTFEPKLDRGLVALTERAGQTITDTAKRNAPWTDRTTNARNGLETNVEHSLNKHRITLFHKVDYGIWLEIAHAGKYRIIMPTLESEGRKLMRNANSLLRRFR